MTSRKLGGFLCLLLAASGAMAAEIPDYPFVFVVGKAEVATPPDIAACSMTLRAREQDADKAALAVKERLKVVLATLKANHIAADDIESFKLEKEIITSDDFGKEQAVIKGYEVRRSIKFTVRQLTSLPPVEMSVIGSPNIADVECQFDRTDRAAMEGDLLTKALQSARDQADKLAGPLGRRINAAVAISRVPFDTIAPALGLGGNTYGERFDMMFKRARNPDEIRGEELLVPATIQLSVSVNVLFKVE
jgi:uncharacterized protein